MSTHLLVGTKALTVLGTSASALALLAGCGGGGASPSAGHSSTSASTSASTSSASGAVVSTRSMSLGTILVDRTGQTVYVFAADRRGASTCAGACAAHWPFVKAPATLPSALPGVRGKLGETTRADGGHQLTIAGRPVYTFVGDTAPGQANGQGSVLDGAVWTVVSPAGKPVTGHPAASSSTSSSPGAGGYSY